jgi:hypothetical protein
MMGSCTRGSSGKFVGAPTWPPLEADEVPVVVAAVDVDVLV